jgi:ribonucleoside-diphosphate reductase alpha chain
MIKLKTGLRTSDLRPPARGSRARKKTGGLKFERFFSKEGRSPLDEVEWERRVAEITDDSGKIIFRQENVEVPKSWSALATKIAV